MFYVVYAVPGGAWCSRWCLVFQVVPAVPGGACCSRWCLLFRVVLGVLCGAWCSTLIQILMTLELLDIKPLNTHHGNITPAVPGSHGNMDYRVGEVEDRERPELPGKGVRSNSKEIACDICDKWIHIKCGDASAHTYDDTVRAGEYIHFVCNKCTIKSVVSVSLADHQPSPDQLWTTDNLTISPSDPNSDQFQYFLRKGLHFLHFTARGLLPTLDELKILAAKAKAAVIDVSETWLDHSIDDSEVEMPSDTILRLDRNRDGGGVCLYYVRSDLAFNPRFDLQKDGIETVWAEVLTGVCYWPPKQCDFNTNVLVTTRNNILVDALRNCERAFDWFEAID